ncbi:hypothetical protein [Leptolyngbya ohadii]|uniref:hypothetical protein n=1 Tax=Leptolyngbya ohadii TaxID=1962290 RepID=UPI0015C68474|nr:hypothetical protein [Leptolyngbya ohadii]
MKPYAGVTGSFNCSTPDLQVKLYAGVTGYFSENYTPELQATSQKSYAGVTGYF